jgi:hypothetical protein
MPMAGTGKALVVALGLVPVLRLRDYGYSTVWLRLEDLLLLVVL